MAAETALALSPDRTRRDVRASGKPRGLVHATSTPLHLGRTTMVWGTRVTDAPALLLSMTIQTQVVLNA
jgi:acyl-coenzyme A thioesterase PaaI-like protein